MKEGENEQKGFPVDTGVIKDFHGHCWLGRGRHNVEKGWRGGQGFRHILDPISDPILNPILKPNIEPDIEPDIEPNIEPNIETQC